VSGGIFSKIGNWYEEEGVIRHHLLVLDEQEQVLEWEGLDLDEPGVDCLVTNDRGRIAEQYKTKSDGTWSISDLKDSRKRADGTRSSNVLDYARFQLQRTDAGAPLEFHFISNAPAPDLSMAISEARSVTDPQLWMSGSEDFDKVRQKVVRGFGLDPASPADVVEVHGLLRRMLVRTIDNQTLKENNQIIARIIAPSSPDRLIKILSDLARESLTFRITTQDTRRAVAAAGIDLVAPAGHVRNADILNDAVAVYSGWLAAARRLAVVPREDIAGFAAREALATDRARTVIVHGPAGVGKSEVLLQTIEKLQASGVPTLVMRADQAAQPPLGPDPVRTLSRYAGGGRGCLIIDQLDQVILAGDRLQPLIALLTEWIILARAMNIAVVIGCRTIDVEQDTYLRRVLCPDDADRCRKIEVKDLTEEQSTAILTRAGIPVSTIHPELVPLVRRPLVLRLLTESVKSGGAYSGARTILDLTVAWWGYMSRPHEALANDILNAFVDAVEKDGELEVDRLSLPHLSVVDQLISTGVLINSGNSRVRPFHQVLVDVWLALQWKNVGSIADLLERIGHRSEQTVHHARRLRLAVQLFANRGARGASICDGILHSPKVRPILKRAMLLGIAAIDEPTQPWVDLVTRWLADPHYFGIVRATVVYNRLAWMDKLDSWLEGAWTIYPAEHRHQLINLLAAVGESRGDLVAKCLLAWSRHDPTVLQQAEFVFWHDPSKDSDRLFELRLQRYAEMQQHRDRHLPWDKLLAANPMRAVRLLAYHFNRANDEELQGRAPNWFHSWPLSLPAQVRETGLNFWDLIRDRWLQIRIEHHWRIRVSGVTSPLDRCVLASVVELLAECLAYVLRNGKLTWSGLVAQLPAEARQIDKWLLLRVGAACDPQHTSSGVLSEAVRWFMSDVTLGQILIGTAIESSRFAEAFLGRIAVGLDRPTPDEQPKTRCHAELERWLISYPERLVAATRQPDDDLGRETERAERMAYRLLVQTDRQRWAAETVSFYNRLHRMFDNGTSVSEPDFRPRVGRVRSDIQEDRALEMSCEEWVAALQSASPSQTWTKSETETEADTILSGDLEIRLRQLRRVVHRNQRRFYDGLSVFLAAVPPLPSEVLDIVVDGIVTTSHPDRLRPDQAGVPLEDALIVNLFTNPRIRDSEGTVMSLTDAVRNRSKAAWPDEVIARLESIARGETRAGFHHDGSFEIANYRLNERCCRAIDALANVAHDHEERRGELLALAESLQDHPDAGRRASVGLLAVQAYSVDPLRGFNVVLSVASDPEIAAEHDVADALLVMVTCPKATEEQKQSARNILLGLVRGNDRQARCGGSSALLLRAWDVITPQEMMSALTHSVAARTAAASTLAEWLQFEKAPPPWMRELALQFAEDESDEVGKAILRVFDESYEHLLAISGFFPAMAKSRAASHESQGLLKLFCRSADIVILAPEVINVTTALAEKKATDENRWSLQHELDLGVNALQALVSQAEQENNNSVRSRALDVWDRLIERDELVAQNKLDKATDFTLG
jgi:hypothetical protein